MVHMYADQIIADGFQQQSCYYRTVYTSGKCQ